MNRLPDVIYLHGLGSSPGSDKARLVMGHLGSLGYRTEAPSLSVPSLVMLSVDAAVATAQRCIKERSAGSSVVLVGSSFGGFVALHAVGRLPLEIRAKVSGIVLLAPVLYPWHPTHGVITPQMEELWRRSGVFPVLEGASGTTVGVRVGFIDELKKYDSYSLKVVSPTLIIHGDRDEVVSVKQSEEYRARNPGTTLVTLSDTHQLMTNPEVLLAHVEGFVRSIRGDL